MVKYCLSHLCSRVKPITLLLESVAAKDMSCLIAGYCRVFGEPNLNIFPWIDDSKLHRVSAEEGRAEKKAFTLSSVDTKMIYILIYAPE